MMIYVLLIFQAALVLGIILFTLGFLITSIKENEHRAAMMAGALSVLLIGKEFYRTHPELEQMDSDRKKAGGLLGITGNIDRPGGSSNIAAMTAAFSIPPHFGKPESHSPAVHATGDKRLSVSAEEATLRVKGFARHLGAGAVGVAKMNPLWVSVSRISAVFAKNARTAAPPVPFPMEIDERSTAMRDGS